MVINRILITGIFLFVLTAVIAQPCLRTDGTQGNTMKTVPLCGGQSFTYKARIPDAQFLWNTGDTSSVRTFTSPGKYWVSISVGGCTYTDTLTVISAPLPMIELGEDQKICGETVIEGVEGFAAYAWSDGTNTPYLITDIPGNYSVVVADSNGCTAIDSITLLNGCADHVQFPAVFTPNADGVNDIFLPHYSGNVQDYHLEIWSRWGKLVFDTDDIRQGWDGRYNDADQPIGSYVYMWEAKLNGELVEEQSTLTLVR